MNLSNVTISSLHDFLERVVLPKMRMYRQGRTVVQTIIDMLLILSR
jgi:hypothetical protein